MRENGRHPLAGRRLYIPRMSTGAALTMAAAFRSVGVEAEVSPAADDETFTLAARHTTGEECLPQRVTLGNFLKVTKQADFDPARTAFLLPTSAGPCRFGQYMNLLKKTLRELGLEDVLVFSPTSSNGYEGIAQKQNRFMRTAWRAVLTADILRKITLMHRPYESRKGDADQAHRISLDSVCSILADGELSSARELQLLIKALGEARDRFAAIPVAEPLGSRPLVGVVGEIYLRFNSFSNQNLIRRIEAHGGEAWIADIAEWVWYTNWEERRKLRESGKRGSLSMLSTRIRHWLQRRVEQVLLWPFM